MTIMNERWWHRIQWIDVVLVVSGVLLLAMITAEWWLPHLGPD